MPPMSGFVSLIKSRGFHSGGHGSFVFRRHQVWRKRGLEALNQTLGAEIGF